MSPTVSDNDNDSGRHEQQERPDALELLQQLLAELREQTRHLAALRAGAEIDSCLLEQIGRIVCMTANETHRNGQLLEGMAELLAALLAMYRGAPSRPGVAARALEPRSRPSCVAAARGRRRRS